MLPFYLRVGDVKMNRVIGLKDILFIVFLFVCGISFGLYASVFISKPEPKTAAANSGCQNDYVLRTQAKYIHKLNGELLELKYNPKDAEGLRKKLAIARMMRN
jgi:hypothetical protein